MLTATQKKACESGVNVGTGRSVGISVGLALGADVATRVGVAADGNVPQAANKSNIEILVARMCLKNFFIIRYSLRLAAEAV